jgi:hypothetical protein
VTVGWSRCLGLPATTMRVTWYILRNRSDYKCGMKGATPTKLAVRGFELTEVFPAPATWWLRGFLVAREGSDV